MISNSMVAHNFAHNVNESSKSGSMFWEKCRTYNTKTARFEETGERVIYSYGHHFAICKIDTNNDICLFTTRTYSNTTAKHISLVRWAISGLYEIIYVNDPDESAQKNAEHFADEIKQLFKKAVAARARKADYLRLIESTYKTACRYLDVMGCKKSGTEYKTINKAYNHTKTATGLKQAETLVKIDRERAKKAREAAKQREIERKLSSAERVAKWETGEIQNLWFGDCDENTPLRVEARKGYKIIKTGKGVEIPMNEAKRVAALILANNLDGLKVNDIYTIREATADVIKIGCHTFKREYLTMWANKVMNY